MAYATNKHRVAESKQLWYPLSEGDLRHTMSEASKSALEFLEQLRKERDELNVLIEGIEKRLGIVSASAASSVPEGALPATPKVKVSINDIPVGYFHNLSQPRAAEKLLRINPGQPLTTQEMLEAFRKSGMQLNPKHAATQLYTALSRNGNFERVAGKAWGLAEWYPERKRKSDREEELSKTVTPEVSEGA